MERPLLSAMSVNVTAPVLLLAVLGAPPAQTVEPTETATVTATEDISGYRVPPDSGRSFGGNVLLATLFIPRLVTKIVLLPIGGIIWVLEHYKIPEFLTDLFFNDARTFGVYPTAFVETGFGLNVGLRMRLSNLFGHASKFTAGVGYGGRFRSVYGADLTTGRLISDVFRFRANARYQDLPNEFYYGLGPAPGDDEIRIQRKRADAGGGFELDVADDLEFAITGVYSHSSVRNSERDPNASLAEFRPFVDLVYEELRATFDTRRSDPLLSEATPSRGVYLSGTIGATQVLNEPTSNFYRYSTDAQWLIDLAYGSRVLVLRLYTEGVFGGEAIPIVEYPRLGGTTLLRGYRRDRFRDRTIALASAEYRYPLSGHTDAYLFVDGGRVFRDWSTFDFTHIGLGFGGGLQIHTRSAVVARIQLAGSRDGDVLFSLVLSPDFEHQPRSER